MENENSAVNDFLGTNDEFQEKTDPFDTPIEVTEEKEEEEKPLPFHKDPKIQRFIDKQVEKAMKDRPSEERSFKEETKDEDDYHIRLIGNDTPEKLAMVREAKSREKKILEDAAEIAYKRLSDDRQREVEAERQADEQLTNSIEEIEENFSVDLTSKDPVARKRRVDFMNFVEKIAPKNAQGEISEFPDMLSAYETFQEIKKVEKPTRAKDIASRSMARSGDATPKPQGRLSFDDADNIFSRLFKN